MFEQESLKNKSNRNRIDEFIGADPHSPPKEVKPTAKMESESKGFVKRKAQASVAWNERTGGPMWMQGELSKPIMGRPSDVGRSFLMENHSALGISDDPRDFKETDSFAWGGLNFTRFQQTYEGFPVFGAELLGTYSANPLPWRRRPHSSCLDFIFCWTQAVVWLYKIEDDCR